MSEDQGLPIAHASEIDLPGGGVAVRDSKNPDRPDLRFTATEWAAFTSALTQGLL